MDSPIPRRSSIVRQVVARPYSAMVGAMLLLIFSSQNMHEVEISLIFGAPAKMPLILVVAGAFVCGFGVAFLVMRRKRNRATARSSTDRELE